MRNLDLCIVEWIDANYTNGPEPFDKTQHHIVLRTAGYFIQQDRKSITLAAEYSAHDDCMRHVINIPMPCVLSVQRISVPRRRGRK